MMLAVSANAQDYSKMSRYVRQMVNGLNNTTQVAAAKGVSPTPLSAEDRTLVFVKTLDDDAVKDYSVAHQGNIHICHVPISEISKLSEDERIIRIEAQENTAEADLDSVASCVKIKPVWKEDASGTAIESLLPQAYDGSGTVVGVVDIGIEYTHPTFRSRDDGHIRLVRAWDILNNPNDAKYNDKAQFPLGTLLTDTTAIIQQQRTTDSPTQTHGTHTMGIAAGSGWDTPYRGMAYNADIYAVGGLVGDNMTYLPENTLQVTTSTLNTLAFQRIFEYADSVGKPAVVSYSISGIQDMTDEDALMNEYLDSLTQKPGHIIVASIGNNGTRHCYMPKSEETDTVGGIISSSNSTFVLNISTKQTLTLRITSYNTNQYKDITLDFKPGNTKKQSHSGLKWNDYKVFSNIEGLDSLTIGVYSGADGFDSEKVGYDIFFSQTVKSFNTVKYGVEVIGSGVAADVFCQNGELISGTQYSPTLLGAQVGANIGSPGALPAVIGVGMTAYWELGNGKRWYGSSIGPSLHGFTKPDITAPGYRVASAQNSLYYSKNPGVYGSCNWSNYNGERYPWTRMNGTSMSTPCVAGIIALWLQANPMLTREDIIDVFANTSRHPEEQLQYPNNQYGYGEIDAYKGLLYILGIDHVEGLQTKHLNSGATVRPVEGGIKIKTEGDTTLPCRIYSTSGQLVMSLSVNGEKRINMPRGIYAVQVGRMGSTLVRVR